MTSQSKTQKVIALISGGKDSFLSILQTQAQGHEIVALANLYPRASAETEVGDLNSHMYQTAGHTLIPFYEQALGIPLYRREIQYDTIQLAREYNYATLDVHCKDETEDLSELLEFVLSKHPDANAICSGAVLSTYQRTRIESVCLRLGLKPLAYLWQMSFLPDLSETESISSKSCSYLDYVADVGLDARIVKVASGGLDESFLWQSLLDPKVRQRIKKTMRKFGGSVIGEGGEYETLVLSGPRTLFKSQIMVPSAAIHTRIGEGGEAWLEIAIDSGINVELDEKQAVLRPHMNPVERIIAASGEDFEMLDNFSWSPVFGIRRTAGMIWINNIHDDCLINPCAEQAMVVVDKLKSILAYENLTAEHLLFAMIVLRKMEDFEAVNTVYGTLFEAPSPAARVTIAAGKQMPAHVDILVSCAVYRGDVRHKEGLHVQSMSHWAPANIGPYSQAVSVPLANGVEVRRITFIAGQIPLVPETMQPLEPEEGSAQENFKAKAKLALRHATRIGVEMKVRWWDYAIAFVCSDPEMGARERAAIAYEIWADLHKLHPSDENDEDDKETGPDAWDIKYGGHRTYATTEDEDRSLPAIPLLGRGAPSFIAAQVDRLPRNQTIEWHMSSTITEGFQSDMSEKIKNVFLCITPQMILEDDAFRELVTIPCRRMWMDSDGELIEKTYGVI